MSTASYVRFDEQDQLFICSGSRIMRLSDQSTANLVAALNGSTAFQFDMLECFASVVVKWIKRHLHRYCFELVVVDGKTTVFVDAADHRSMTLEFDNCEIVFHV